MPLDKRREGGLIAAVRSFGIAPPLGRGIRVRK